ncbi:MAG: membrane protein [Phycisphaerae bacterium]|nr:MAG: VTT domain-containing protein [Planctomycetia bacterium]GJQ27687.1 MAG: membrane protein [Phycisphaerae bacterium]
MQLSKASSVTGGAKGVPAVAVNENTPHSGRSWVRWLNVLSVVSLVACLLILVRVLPVDRAVQALQGGVDRLGAFSPLIFAGAYVLAGLLFVPGSALTIASGALFGLLWGTAIVSIASTINAALAFLIARYFARTTIERAAQRNRRFAAIDHAIGKGGWRIVALLRLSPAVPYSLGNYLYGLTSIRFWPYVLASWICMLPGTFMYVYVGHIGAQGLQAAGGGKDAVGVGKTVLLIAGLAATIVVTVYVTRLARRALAEQGALEPVRGADSNTQMTAQPMTMSRGMRPFILPLAAIAMLAITIAACTQQDAIRGLFGPSSVTLQEAYEQKSEGIAFDHSQFDALLNKHVSDGGWVDYEGLGHDAKALDSYLASLKSAPFDRLGRDEKLALLINAYNACTLRLILDHFDGGKLKSIKDIPASKRWNDRRWNLAGNNWSLNQIEQEQIRPKFKEPRIHFALVCAAVGCPPLRNEAYVGNRIGQQLEDQTRYIHSYGTWFRFDSDARIAYLTPLYKWYGGDFEQVSGSVLKFAASYAETLQAAVNNGKTVRSEWLDYDWRLNSVQNRQER